MKNPTLRPIAIALIAVTVLILLTQIGNLLTAAYNLPAAVGIAARAAAYLIPCLLMARMGAHPLIGEKTKNAASPLPSAALALACGMAVRYFFLVLQELHRMPMFDALAVNGSRAVSALIIAPVAEEFFFRGYLMQTLLPLGSRFASVLCTVLFALWHNSLPGVLNALLCGALLSLCVQKKHGIFACIAVHFALNGTAVLHGVLPKEAATAIDLLLLGAGIAAGIASLLSARARPRTETPTDGMQP